MGYRCSYGVQVRMWGAEEVVGCRCRCGCPGRGSCPEAGDAQQCGAQVPNPPSSSHHLHPSLSQVFLATGMCETEPAFGQAMAALLENLEAFGTAATMAQVLPVLHGRSYLDIASMHCQEEPGRSQGQRDWGQRWCPHRGGWVSPVLCWLLTDTLTPLDMEPLAEVPGNKTVQLVVECPLPWCYELRLYDRPVPVPAAASLLDVLQAAAALEPHDFRYGRVTL